MFSPETVAKFDYVFTMNEHPERWSRTQINKKLLPLPDFFGLPACM
jgi:hypothetical protein